MGGILLLLGLCVSDTRISLILPMLTLDTASYGSGVRAILIPESNNLSTSR